MSGDIYEERARRSRSGHLQAFLDAFVEKFDIDRDFVASPEHPYTCICQKCLAWWARIGPEDNEEMTFGPFTQAQVEAYCNEARMPIWWNQSVTDADTTNTTS